MSFVCRPVALPVRRDAQASGRERALARKRCALAALRSSASASGLPLERFARTPDGAPACSEGWYWSVTHGKRLACAVVAPRRVGIDVEAVRPRRQTLVTAILGRAECALFGGFSWEALARTWTAKEAVLKKLGLGLSGLGTCRLLAVPDENRVVVDVAGTQHLVRQTHRRTAEGEWILALSFDGPHDFDVAWSFGSPTGASAPTGDEA